MTEAWHAFPDPGLIAQADGSPYQWQNCAPTTWAALVTSQQQGKRPAKGSPWYPSGASLRTASGDKSGGIIPSLLDYTVNRVYGIDLEVRIATTTAVQQGLDDGLAVGILIDYSPIAAAGLSGSPGFYGNHSVPMFGTRTLPSGAIEWLDADPLYDGRRAGIPKGPKWVSRLTLIKAAGMLVLDSGGQTVSQRYGPGHLYAVFTTRPYVPGPTIVTSAPSTAAERANPMILGATGVTTTKVQRLQAGQPLFAHPGGPRVTRISGSVPRSISFVGKAGSSWGQVIVNTGAPYKDGTPRPTGLYVPLSAGPISIR